MTTQPQKVRYDARDILTRVGDQLGIRRVFGEPIDRDGVTVVPVAVSIGGGGGGNAPENQGSGGGFGGMVRGIGAYSIRNGQVRFVPAVDTTATGGAVRPRRRRRSPRETTGGLTKARGDSSRLGW